MDTYLKRPGSLTEHLVSFCRFLRSHGFIIGPREEIEMLQVLTGIPFRDVDCFQLTLAQLLTKSKKQHLAFAGLFREFWEELFSAFDAKIKSSPSRAEPKNTPDRTPSLDALKHWLYNEKADLQEDTAFYSAGVRAFAADLSTYHAHQVEELVKIVNRMARNWATRQSRRMVRSKNRGGINLRDTIRKNLNTGEIVEICRREKKLQKLELVLLCDVSKSMELFSKFTVQLLYAFQNSYQSIETFIFGTSLHRITQLLRYNNFEASMSQLSRQVPDWSGGTRTGQSLKALIDGYGSQLLHRKVIFLMISDGWDRGDLELLDWSMNYIQRRVKKVIWFNPLAGKPDYQPAVQGMKTALPYIDIFHGVYNLESLRSWQQGGYRSR